MTDTDDLGHVAAIALATPDEHVGEAIDTAGDGKSLVETPDILTEGTAPDIEAVHVPTENAYETFGEAVTARGSTSGVLRATDWADKQGMHSIPVGSSRLRAPFG